MSRPKRNARRVQHNASTDRRINVATLAVAAVGTLAAIIGVVEAAYFPLRDEARAQPRLEVSTVLMRQSASTLFQPGRPPVTGSATHTQVVKLINTGGSPATVANIETSGQPIQAWAVLDPTTGDIVKEGLAEIPPDGVRYLLVANPDGAGFNLGYTFNDAAGTPIPKTDVPTGSADAIELKLTSRCNSDPAACPAKLN